MEKRLRACGIALKSASDDGEIEAIVSVFGNVDSYNERVMPGAFTKSIARKLPKGVWMHDWSQPVAKTLEARELAPDDQLIKSLALPDEVKAAGGLYIRGKFNLNTQRGREAYSDVKEEIVDEFSIGYETLSDGQGTDGVRELLEINLFEWSPVLVGANRSTALLGIKQQMSFDDDCAAMHEDVVRFLGRCKSRTDMRLKEGRVLSSSNVARVTAFLEAIKAGVADMEDMISHAAPQKDAALRQRQLRLKYQHMTRGQA